MIMSAANSKLIKMLYRAGRFFLFVVSVFFFPIVLLNLMGLPIVWEGIPSHHGDGEFWDGSHRLIGPFGTYFYSIQMPGFDLGNPYEEVYTVSNLTPLRSRSGGLGVYLGLNDDVFFEDYEPLLVSKKLNGTFQILIKDLNGKLIHQVDGAMSDCRWMHTRTVKSVQTGSREEIYLLYQPLKKNSFAPTKSETYQIFLSYSPDPRLKGIKGFVYLEYPRV